MIKIVVEEIIKEEFKDQPYKEMKYSRKYFKIDSEGD